MDLWLRLWKIGETVPYLRVFWRILQWIFGLFVVIGVLGGIIADIPGVADDPAASAILWYVSRLLTFLLRVVGNYWDGVLIFLIVLTIVIRFLEVNAIGHHEKEFEDRRKKKLGKGKRK